MIWHDLHCPTCNETMRDFALQSSWDLRDLRHFSCGSPVEVISGSRQHHAAVHQRESCVVFRDASGKIRYPTSNTAPTPPGCERVELRSWRELQQFSREHNVRNELEGYEHSGSTGRGFESEPGFDGRPVAPMRHRGDWR